MSDKDLLENKDLLEKIKASMQARITELQPMVDEHKLLVAALNSLTTPKRRGRPPKNQA